MLFDVAPAIYAPARWGALVWTFVALAAIEEDELAVQMRQAWRFVAPKRLQRSPGLDKGRPAR